MTVKESPALTEAPVRYPRTIDEDAFFYYPENETFIHQHSNVARVPNPAQLYGLDTAILLAGLIGVFVVALLLGNLIPLPITLVLTMILWVMGHSALIDYLGKRHSRAITQRFLNAGTILNGKIVSCVGTAGRGKDTRFFVEATYEYLNPNGERREASIKTARPDLEGKQLPAPGTPVYVLYFRDGENYLL